MSAVRQRKVQRGALGTSNRPSPGGSKSNQSDSWASFCCKLVLWSIAATACLLGYVYVRAPIKCVAYPDELEVIKYEGVFEMNNKLSSGVKISGLNAPESHVVDEDGNIYTSQKDGRIVKISPSDDGEIGAGKISYLLDQTKVPGAVSSNPDRETGWSLGLRLYGNTLYYIDTFYGLCSVDITTGEFHHLLGNDNVAPPMKSSDDLVITKDGKTIYITDFSVSAHMMEMSKIGLSGSCDGRILKYDVASGTAAVVKTGLCTPNSIELSSDEKRAFITLTMRYKVAIYDVDTWEFIKYVPVAGHPDNIRVTPRGTYWIAGQTKLVDSMLDINTALDRSPVLRQIIGGLLTSEQVIKTQVHTFNGLYEMSDEGEIIRVLYDPDGSLAYGLTQGTELQDGRILLGSYLADFLAISNPQ